MASQPIRLDQQEPCLTKARLFCPVCQDSTFKTLEALRSHQTLLGHKLPCPHCNKRFVTSEALSQHVQIAQKPQDTLQAGTFAVAPSATTVGVPSCASATSISNTSLPIEQNEDHKTVVAVSSLAQIIDELKISSSVQEQEIILQSLLSRCHPLTRLNTNGYTMSPVPTEESGSGKGIIRRDLFRYTSPPMPDSFGYRKGRKAVVIDCKMVQVTRGRQEIGFINAVDFFTGEVLMSQYVKPQYRVTGWDTKVSGITPASMAAAIESGEALRGWLGARWALWEFVDSDTVLIGHALQNDLHTLGIIHSRVVDSSILTAEAIFNNIRPTEPLPRVWGLKALAGDMLARKIQGGRKGRSVVEDAIATRDVVIWCLKKPDLLSTWADNARSYHQMQEELRKEAKGKKAEGERRKKKEKQAK
ncbi:hypothetical protein BO94DRAFT_503121 [Aspergillus sclerotioniger CBS 115572]|uniref:Uncharacterized protein n=1 Tax=Aspergillus sclerotioniger CBS 115572 TaxID=1450535 RepID=A0A317V4G9_9EURO|nr:hypothetical protein BO94DRAFT_503121 [Aspergillus sclerotioniger CBS 115572]PWY68995.1 hypothetical protein BO94DRAFT_503121 [Aspergillus sclerotioniger CBS 115572]